MYHKKNLPEGVNIVGVGIPKISKRSDKSIKSYSKKILGGSPWAAEG